jgi:hypothetical protein
VLSYFQLAPAPTCTLEMACEGLDTQRLGHSPRVHQVRGTTISTLPLSTFQFASRSRSNRMDRRNRGSAASGRGRLRPRKNSVLSSTFQGRQTSAWVDHAHAWSSNSRLTSSGKINTADCFVIIGRSLRILSKTRHLFAHTSRQFTKLKATNLHLRQ